ncbi:peptide-methionine (R)-S-oxide reductase [Lujinxingia litoralis]|uniref:peptide-methionine (R)-S-oxide reductase n=2 Tax=Lujinxingia litoralis TaxID=2211119 RepID=A0A328C4F9_9DELT|nr:peptide-methionine (R)-S-oxide reductase [Lujinxingia litoralis]
MTLGLLGLVALGLLSGASCSANSGQSTGVRQAYVIAQAQQDAHLHDEPGFERPTLQDIPLAEAEPEVVLSEEEWRHRLSPEAFRILRQQGTERAGSGELLHVKEAGTFVCAGCGQELFSSETKYDSRTGWPSFWAPISEDAVGTMMDTSHGMRRVEVHCARCGGHLGHIFTDGPQPTGLRYCVNSDAMSFTPADTPKLQSTSPKAGDSRAPESVETTEPVEAPASEAPAEGEAATSSASAAD